MGQVLFKENIEDLVLATTTTVTLASSIVNIGGQQYRNSSTITLDFGTTGLNGLDVGSVAASSVYNVFAVSSSSALGLVASLASAPSGFTQYQLVGVATTFASSATIASITNTTEARETQDKIDSLGGKTKSTDQAVLSDMSVPFTGILGRAPIKDVSKMPTPRMGIERISWDSDIELVTSESVPNGFPISRTPADPYDRVRFVGDWSNKLETQNDGKGVILNYLWSDPNVYIEVTFYGTGMNILAGIRDVNNNVDLEIDGVGAGVLVLSGNQVLLDRNTKTNQVISVTSGLALGWHTVKLKGKPGHDKFPYLYGYEVVNEPTVEATPLEIQAGSVIVGDEQFDVPATSLSYNADFDASSDAVGTKGGHVVVYAEKVDGVTSVKKRFSAVNATQLNLGAADHSNEDVIAKYHWRQFGAGRADDFSTLTSATSDRYFTLDDGTTTLVGDDVLESGGYLYMGVDNRSFILTFVGTGLDITIDASGTRSFDVDIDDVSIGTISISGGLAGYVNTEKVVSGLPYGTHTVNFTRPAGLSGIGVNDFIIHGPKKAEVPAGAVELSSYYLMADYAANTSAGLEKVALGVLRKDSSRELFYSGTFSTHISLSRIGSIDVRSTVTSSFAEYTFYGTGFEYRAISASDRGNIIIAIDGANYTGAGSVYGTGVVWTPGSSTLDFADASNSPGAGFSVSGLPLGIHTVRFTHSTGTYMGMGALDIITPIHTPEADRNNSHSKLVGSNSIRNELALPNYQKGKQHFPDGVDLGASKLRCQTKTSTANGTFSGVATSLFKFSGLVPGRIYQLIGAVAVRYNTGESMSMTVDGAQSLDGFSDINPMRLTNTSGGDQGMTVPINVVFIATATSINVRSDGTGGTPTWEAQAAEARTYCTLMELSNHVVTNEW